MTEGRAKEIGADLTEGEGSRAPFVWRPAELADRIVGL
jgi:hypothetical protein